MNTHSYDAKLYLASFSLSGGDPLENPHGLCPICPERLEAASLRCPDISLVQINFI